MSFTVEGLESEMMALTSQKERHMQNYYQTCGAISLLEQQISFLKTPKQEPVKDPMQEKVFGNSKVEDFMGRN